MHARWICLLAAWLAVLADAAPVINPVANVTVPAGKSIIIPITATVTNGRPLTYTITGSTNAMAIVMHTNNPFWKLNVAQACATNAPGSFQTPFRGSTATVTNVGDMVFMLFPEYAPQTVSIFQGLSAAGFYNSNTIFHRVVSNFVIQGGDPLTNGLGGLVFQYNDEFNPQAIFSGSGQLALANSGKNTDGSQFFATVGPQRNLDFGYTLFGQLVRGFNVLSNIDGTAVDANSRPLANEIITQAAFVPDTSDTVITLTATNLSGIADTITVIANDGAGGLATNTFTAVSITDFYSNNQPFIVPNTVTNFVAPVNGPLTNLIETAELDGYSINWWLLPGDDNSQSNSVLSGYYTNYIFQTLTYDEINYDGGIQFFVTPATNYTGPITIKFYSSPYSSWYNYFQTNLNSYGNGEAGPLPPYAKMVCTFVFGDTPITAQAAAVPPRPPGAFTNLLLATFTNGVSGSALTNFTASIQWGDDSTNTATITTNLSKIKQVYGSHMYPYPGVYPISITIQSRLGVTTVVSNSITVIPSLSFTRTGTNNIFAWPSWASAYSLQSNTNLAGTNWFTATNFPALAGFQNAITNPAAGSQTFFRLKD